MFGEVMNQGIRALSGQGGLCATLLEEASLPTMVPMLRARERWFLLVETLLGHGTVRGGRGRDFPFSHQRGRSTRLALALAGVVEGFRPGAKSQLAHICIYDVLVALHCIGMARTMHFTDPLKQEHYYSTALEVLLEYLFDPLEAEQIRDLIGLSRNGVECTRSMRKRFRRQDLRLAQCAAAMASVSLSDQHESDPTKWLTERFGLRNEDLQALDAIRVNLLVIKVKGAQRFLDTCIKPFIQRGASAWCSLVASRARDSLTHSQMLPISLLIDNDAVTTFLCPSDLGLPDIEQTLRNFFLDESPENLSREFVARYCPRLMPYYESACQASQMTAQVLPSLGYELRQDCSLLQLSTQCVAMASELSETETGVRLMQFCRGRQPLDEPACSGHLGSVVLPEKRHQMPLWYNPSGDQAYGFIATTFSLAEITYSRMTRVMIREQLRSHYGMDVRAPENQQGLLRLLPGGDEGRLTYLKYDGDAIGRLFLSQPMIRRPAISIHLERLIRDAWIESVVELIRDRGLDGIPVDLVYMGGDDLLMVLPDVLVKEFIQYFDTRLTRGEGLGITFTFAGLSGITVADARSTNVLNRVNDLLARIKVLRKGRQLEAHAEKHFEPVICRKSAGAIIPACAVPDDTGISRKVIIPCQ